VWSKISFKHPSIRPGIDTLNLLEKGSEQPFTLLPPVLNQIVSNVGCADLVMLRQLPNYLVATTFQRAQSVIFRPGGILTHLAPWEGLWEPSKSSKLMTFLPDELIEQHA